MQYPFLYFLILAAFLLIFRNYLFGSSQKDKSKSNVRKSKEMTREEALDILGLKEGSDRDIIQKNHRELLKKLHPDHGGSNYLTAMINEAKSVLLKE